MDSLKLHCVPPGNIRHVWQDIAPYVENAAIKGPGQVDVEGLKKACETGIRQLWVVTKGSRYLAAAITDTFHEPYKTVLEFVTVGGREMEEWVHYEQEITNRAKHDIGATVARVGCRPGMMRKLEPRGYRITGYLMERAL